MGIGRNIKIITKNKGMTLVELSKKVVYHYILFMRLRVMTQIMQRFALLIN